jgi:hypothetical protein
MELVFNHFNYHNNLAEQRELFNDCFPETKGDKIQSVEHYSWKFHSFPNNIHSWEYAVYFGDTIVGYYAAIPYRYKIGERETNVAMVCDVMTSPKHRGKGIFTKLGNFATSDLSNSVPFSTGYPIRKEVIPGHLKVGWKVAIPLPLYIKFLSADSFLKDRKIGFLRFIFNPLLAIYNFSHKTGIIKKYSCFITDDICNIQGYNEFIAKWSTGIRNCLIKDFEFAKWRYSAPNRFYKFIAIIHEDNLVGFVSFRKTLRQGVPSYGILDYMVLQGYNDCHGLINKILKEEALKDEVECILCMMSKCSASYYKLSKNGFLKSPYKFQLIIKNLTNKFSDEELFNESNWHLMWVDSDDL